MLGRGLYSSINKKLPGIYVNVNFTSNETVNSVRLYAYGDSNVTLALSHPYTLKCADDSNGNVTLLDSYGCKLNSAYNNKGNVIMEVN